MKCPNCQSQNIQQARFCVNCGYSLTRVPKRNNKMWWVFGSMLVVFCVIWTAVIVVYMQSQEEKEVVKSSVEKAAVQEEPPAEEEKPEAEQPPQEEEEETVAAPSKKEPETKETVVKEDKVNKKELIDQALSKVYTVLTNEGQGSGFLYRDSGKVVTNAHVVYGYSDVIIQDREGVRYPARVIGVSDEYDLALLSVDGLIGEKPLPIELEKSMTGMEVIAVGSPRGLQNTASPGYLTGVGRQFDDPQYTYENLYQVDAQISPGSSGGPLLSAENGKVIGINSAILTDDQSIGFSMPMYTMVDLLNQWSQSPMTAAEVNGVYGYDQGYATSGSYDTYDGGYNDEPEEDNYPDIGRELSDFIISFRNSYEDALDYQDFSYIEGFLEYEGEAYWELYDYIEDTKGKGMKFDFTYNEVTNVVIEDGYAIVSTYEVFDFMNAAGNWSVYERVKDYTVVVDEYGYYVISSIEIYE
ncbi:trypsin-like peptidase domain-containing protein [Pontibacillus salipaludis]|uniref:trypsin-like peptidase domain-containing protein n=1 Tax=Pontibacillus salipaludis TaxID=1697394 RepID=UPI0031EF08C7